MVVVSSLPAVDWGEKYVIRMWSRAGQSKGETLFEPCQGPRGVVYGGCLDSGADVGESNSNLYGHGSGEKFTQQQSWTYTKVIVGPAPSLRSGCIDAPAQRSVAHDPMSSFRRLEGAKQPFSLLGRRRRGAQRGVLFGGRGADLCQRWGPSVDRGSLQHEAGQSAMRPLPSSAAAKCRADTDAKRDHAFAKQTARSAVFTYEMGHGYPATNA
jgi:hypothetical protein